MRRAAAFVCTALMVLGAAWACGFSAFDRAARAMHDDPPQADAIVALTGGAARVEAALQLLVDGRAPLLLISGVGRGPELPELSRRVPLTAGQSKAVTLGRAATTTVENAAETAAWVRAHGVRELIVVTASYHMPRALLELQRALPGVALHPAAVQPPALRGGVEFATVRLMASEFDKYLAVRLGLTRRAEAEAQ